MSTINKYFHISVTEHEYNVFGDTGAEVCSELATLCPAFARAVSDFYNLEHAVKYMSKLNYLL